MVSWDRGRVRQCQSNFFHVDLCEEHQKYTKHYLRDLSLIASYFLASIWRRLTNLMLPDKMKK